MEIDVWISDCVEVMNGVLMVAVGAERTVMQLRWRWKRSGEDECGCAARYVCDGAMV